MNIFFSYSYKDHDEIYEIQKELQDYLNIWTYNTKLYSGQNINKSIESVIKKCDIFIVFISKESLKSANVLLN